MIDTNKLKDFLEKLRAIQKMENNLVNEFLESFGFERDENKKYFLYNVKKKNTIETIFVIKEVVTVDTELINRYHYIFVEDYGLKASITIFKDGTVETIWV